MPIFDLKDQIARLPEQPGVYLYANAAGETIYVGKARVLRDRVRNYLGARGADPKTDALLDEVQALSFIVTDSVSEALALESNLIKQRSPKYNILLRDDKSYPYLQLTTGEAFPRLLVARRVEEDEHAYFGPFLPARLARRTIDLTHRLFGLRSCNEVITGERGRPCLEYDIKRCVAPCVAALCSRGRLRRGGGRRAPAARREARRARRRPRSPDAGRRRGGALRGGGALARRRPHRRGAARSAAEDGHRGARRSRRVRRPARAARRGGAWCSRCAAAASSIASSCGAMACRWPAGVDGTRPSPASREAEVVAAALSQFYAVHVPPPEVHVPEPLEDAAAIEDWLSGRRRRGAGCGSSCRAAATSAACWSWRRATPGWPTSRASRETPAGAEDALEALRLVLQLPATPRRIDCFDISTFQGSETVASMVVCEDGRMQPREYRKFRIRPGEDAPLPAGVTAAGARRRGGREPDRGRPDPRRLQVDAPGRAPALSGGRRARRADAGPDRDRRRQGPARRPPTRR